jgi:hypothetical protein
MSLPDTASGRKPRRLGLILPFVIALVLIIAWAIGWFWLRSQAVRGMDAQIEQMRNSGYEVAWKQRQVGGFPFRLGVTLTEARIREPSGWALAAPRLEAQAPVYALDSWIAAVPEGLTFTRPIGGPVEVRGRLIRASLGELSDSPPSFSFEGRDLTFAPGPGAQPFALSAAESVELHLRAMPEDQGVVRFRVDQGKARLSGLFAQIAGEKPVSMIFEGVFDKAGSFRGSDWASAVRAWTDAGGRLSVRQGGVTAGEALIGAQSGTLTVGTDGRLRGTLDASLQQAPRALEAMSATGVIPQEAAEAASAVAQARALGGDLARATLTFQAGRTTLGPVAIGPAPRVY